MSELGEKVMPVQGGNHYGRGQGQIGVDVYMAAYEVYAEVYGPQEAMLHGHCRGGFGKGELVAFLYARSFPREQWHARIDEAMEGMDI